MEYSETEFEILYKQRFPSLMRLAMLLLHDEDEARDVVQEVFVKLWETDILITNPTAFLTKSVRNACLNRINMLDTRDRIRQRIMLDPPPDDVDIECRCSEIRSAVGRLLTPREQDVVDRIYTGSMSYREAAEDLDISVASINKNIVSALKKLRAHFKTEKS